MSLNIFSRRRTASRRSFLKTALAATAGGALLPTAARAEGEEFETLPFENGTRPLVKYPQKRPLLRLTTRPPQLETPFSVFNEGVITPNDAFFVRYHLASPPSIDTDTYRLQVKGNVKNPLTLSLAELKSQFELVEVVAVNQCSGNSRGFSKPRVQGGQLGHGAMGNARWRGVRLKDLLDKAGLAAGTKQVMFDGLDRPLLPQTPDFVKAIEADHALDGEILLACEMNGEDLPWLNGFPLRLVVPGHYGTYWVKHVHEITVLDKPLESFWMNPAYRIPDNECGFIEPGTTAKKTTPITRFNVRSFITSLREGASIPAGRTATVRGIAFDGGFGIREVLFSEDGGASWRAARLGADLGKYSFREWTIDFTPKKSGEYLLQAKATNRIGQSQPSEALWNPSGYMRNVVETVKISAA